MAEISNWCPLYDFPECADLVGRMLVNYGELEMTFIRLVSLASNIDMDASLRLMFRPRSEAARIDILDAIVRPKCAELGLLSSFENCLTMLNTCKSFRNTYAHCHWHNTENGLAFVSLDEAARTISGPTEMSIRDTDSTLLKKQYDYFSNTHHHMAYLRREMMFCLDNAVINDLEVPKALHEPRPYNQPKRPKRPKQTINKKRQREAARLAKAQKTKPALG